MPKSFTCDQKAQTCTEDNQTKSPANGGKNVTVCHAECATPNDTGGGSNDEMMETVGIVVAAVAGICVLAVGIAKWRAGQRAAAVADRRPLLQRDSDPFDTNNKLRL